MYPKMKNLALLLVAFTCMSVLLFGQTQLDIQGTISTSTVAKIEVNYFGEEDVVGLDVTSLPSSRNGIGGRFIGGDKGVYGLSDFGTVVFGFSSTTGTGVYGYSGQSSGVFGDAITGVGIRGRSDLNLGVFGQSTDSIGVYGQSTSSTGAYFYGGGGVAIELGGSDSDYGVGDDDAVIRTQADQTSSDMILVSNDKIHLHLDDDNNDNLEDFKIFNGEDAEILKLDKNGNLTISGTYSPSSDRNRKEQISPVDPSGILTKVAELPIAEWQFKGEDIRHLGPMAQDFYDSFGLGQGRNDYRYRRLRWRCPGSYPGALPGRPKE